MQLYEYINLSILHISKLALQFLNKLKSTSVTIKIFMSAQEKNIHDKC